MTTSLLKTLDFRTDDKIIAVKENKNGDANFILTSIISKCISDQENVCLVILHNTLGHYQNVGKKLNYDLLNHIQERRAKVIEPLKEIAQEFGRSNQSHKYLIEDKERIASTLFMDVKNAVDELSENGCRTTLIIDDVSHLLDLGIPLRHVVKFVTYCKYLSAHQNAAVVINCHVSCEQSLILANTLFHAADICLTVSPLRTGRSLMVTGSLTIRKQNLGESFVNKEQLYHYKLLDKEIRTFHHGKAFI